MNIRSLCSISVLALAVLLSSGTAWAAETTASASARLIQPIGITNGYPLNFGTLLKGSLSGPVTITLDPQVGNLPSITSSNPSAVAPFRGHTDATFLVTGEPLEVIVVSYPSAILLQKLGGGSTAREMTIENIQVDVWEPSSMTNDLFSGNSFTMPAAATAHLEVGGTLTVNEEDERGLYTGSFLITLNYL